MIEQNKNKIKIYPLTFPFSLSVYIPTQRSSSVGVVVKRLRDLFLSVLVVIGLIITGPNNATAQNTPSDSTPLKAFEHCIAGEVSPEEAQQVGKAIGSRGYKVTFDDSLFPPACANAIAPFLFSTYNETISLQLVNFFWRPEFFERLYEASTNAQPPLKCGLLCFLSLEKRQLPDLSTFRLLQEKPLSQKVDAQALFLARAMFVAPELDTARAAGLIKEFPPDMQRRIVLSLYLLGSAPFLLSHYHYANDTICLSDDCAPIDAVRETFDCASFQQAIETTKSIEKFVALKHWVMTDGKSLIETCVANELKTPYDPRNISTIASAHYLSLFEPSVDLSVLETASRNGAFKNFSFLDNDISRIDNIDFQMLNVITSSFSRRLVEQLANDPTYVAQLSTVGLASAAYAPDNFFEEAARLRYLICVNARGATSACNQTTTYLGEIAYTLSLESDHD